MGNPKPALAPTPVVKSPKLGVIKLKQQQSLTLAEKVGRAAAKRKTTKPVK